MFFINQGVGVGQPNRARDVAMVQRLLNMNIGPLNRRRAQLLHPVDVTGHFDLPTHALLAAHCQAIGHYDAPVVKAHASWFWQGQDAANNAQEDPSYWESKLLSDDLDLFVGQIAPKAPAPAIAAVTGDQLAKMDRVLRSLVNGALAWQGLYPPTDDDPVLVALDHGFMTGWAEFKALCRMRQSRALLMVLLAMAPTIRQNKKATVEALAESIQLAMDLADISTPLRKAAFLAQVAAESDGFRALREYATGAAYEGRADLGNVLPGDGVLFAGRGYIQLTGRSNYTRAWSDMGLPTKANDKLKPHTVGPKAPFKSTLEPDDPAYAETLEGAAKATAWYWNHHNLNAISDKLTTVGGQEDVLLKLSIAINGKNKKTGLPNGWGERKRYFKAAKHALGIH